MGFANSPWIDENFNTAQIWTKNPSQEKIQSFDSVSFS
jgi:hypothetical protein